MSWAVTTSAAVAAVLAVSFAFIQRRKRLRYQIDAEAAQSLVEVGNDPVMVADIVDGQLLLVNAAMCTLLDYRRNVLLQRRLPQLHPREMVEQSAQRIAEIWERKGMVYSDLPFVRRDGARIAVETSANVVRFQGHPAVVLHSRDIRQRLEAEQKIRDYATELEQKNRDLHEMQGQLVQSEKMAALGNLVAGVCHEINTPVGAIRANTDVASHALQLIEQGLAGEGLASDDADRRLSRALETLQRVCAINHDATDRIATIVRALSNFARLDESEEKTVDLHQGIDSTLTLLQHQLTANVSVVKNYAPLPAVRCYPNQLNQVFMNLLTNAIHAIGGKGTITITTEHATDSVVLRFHDSGPGIATQHLSRIFDPGFTTKGVGVGTGLGLSIAYRIVDNHGGQINVESTAGNGAEFIIRLPINRTASPVRQPIS